MPGKTVRLFGIFLLLMTGGLEASAAPPSESVTVTAARSREVLQKFTRNFATPTVVTGKIARWERGICPVVSGQNPHFTRFIMQRVKAVALAAGAPVNNEASCLPNIEIVFTTTPQPLLDSVRKTDPDYLGWATSAAQRDALATVTRPVQAWYTTETMDLNGARSVDRGMPLGEGIKIFTDVAAQRDAYVRQVARSNGNRIDNGIHSGFHHILIVIDTSRLAGQKIVPLADYISLLALTQLASPDVCQPLPSVANLLVADCQDAADGLSRFDLAYLQGIYKHMEAGRELALQRDDIADAMMGAPPPAK